MPKPLKISWLETPEDKDYPAAESYLSLHHPPPVVKNTVKLLRKAKITGFKSKDIFRASGLSLLGISNFHVQTDREKISKGKKVSPILLVRDPANGRVLVADGYHRLCAVYSFDEDAVIPCKIV